MYLRVACSASRVLSSPSRIKASFPRKISQEKYHFLSIQTGLFEKKAFNKELTKMASPGQQFPPQRQETHPGKEHVMDPAPQAFSHEYNKPSNKLQGKVALITGGDSSIGGAVYHCFALEGATVAFTYIKGQEDTDAHETLQALLKAKTPDAKEPIAVTADLGYDENCKKVVDEVVNAFGQTDILVNNAAEQYKVSSVEEIDEERIERVFRTNIFSYFFMVRHALKYMREGSSIINSTSVTAYKGNSKLLDYTARKVQLWLPLEDYHFNWSGKAYVSTESLPDRSGLH